MCLEKFSISSFLRGAVDYCNVDDTMFYSFSIMHESGEVVLINESSSALDRTYCTAVSSEF